MINKVNAGGIGHSHFPSRGQRAKERCRLLLSNGKLRGNLSGIELPVGWAGIHNGILETGINPGSSPRVVVDKVSPSIGGISLFYNCKYFLVRIIVIEPSYPIQSEEDLEVGLMLEPGQERGQQ